MVQWKFVDSEPVSLVGYCLCVIFMRNPNGLWDFHNILRDQHLGTKLKPSASKIILKGWRSRHLTKTLSTLRLHRYTLVESALPGRPRFSSNLSLPCILIEFVILSVY